MNHKILLPSAAAVSVAILTLVTAAVPSGAGTLVVGVKGGVTRSTFRSDPDASIFEWGHRTGFTGGAFAYYPLGGSVSAQADIAYVQRGASAGESEGTDADGNVLGFIETTYVRDDLAIGLLGRVVPFGGGSLRPYFLVGPSLLMELSEKLSLSGAESVSWNVDQLRSTEVALDLGAGVEKSLGTGRWLLELRYELGLTEISEPSYPTSLHTSSWRLVTGYAF